MLPPDDRQLIERDSALPGLERVLDPELLAADLAPYLPPDHRPRIATYVRYKPGTGCLVAFRTGAPGMEGLMYARAFAASAAGKLKKVHDSASRGNGPAPIVLDGQNIVVWRFPSDRRLKSLARLADEQSRSGFFRRLFPGRMFLGAAQVELLRYKPERRLVVRLSAGGAPAAVLKLYDAADYHHGPASGQQLMSTGLLRLPRRIAHSGRHRAVAYQWLPGELLAERLAVSTSPREEIQRAGEALALLHRQPVGTAQRDSGESAVRRLFEVASHIGQVLPSAATMAQELAERAGAELTERPLMLGFIHGDFYASQVVLDDGCVGIIDLDAASIGDPAEDLGNFIAHLHRAACSGAWPLDRVQTNAEALLEGYRDSSVLSRVVAHTAAGLLRIAPHPFRSREPDWAARTIALLERGHALLDGQRQQRADQLEAVTVPPEQLRRRRAILVDPFHLARDPEMEFLSEALDPPRAEERLIPLLRSLADMHGGLRLMEIRVVRYKPGRRGLIQYRFGKPGHDNGQPSVTILGKCRVKGLDQRALDVVQELWDVGFNDRGEQAFCVPKPLGAITPWRMWFQREVPGTPATKLLCRPDGWRLSERIAEAIAGLQDAGIAPKRAHSLANELAILQQRLPHVAEAVPSWRDRICRILETCERLAEVMPAVPTCPSHRDFYADHVLVDGSRLHLLDFDLFCRGDAGLDIGNFCGHLIEQGVRRPQHQGVLARHQQLLEDRFADLRGESARQSVRTYTLLTLVRHIHLSTTLADRRGFTSRLIEVCEEHICTQQRRSSS